MLKKFFLLTVMLGIVFLTCSCSQNQNSSSKFNDNFWSKKGELRIALNAVISTEPQVEKANLALVSDEMKEYQKTKVYELKDKMKNYFSKEYNLDISDKLSNQEIRFFKDTPSNGASKSWTGGFFNPDEPHALYLSELLLHDKSSYFQSVYIRQTMYSIGIYSKDLKVILDDGFADNEAKDFCEYEKLSYSSIGSTSFLKGLAYQIKIANPDIIKNYISDNKFSISDEISSKLKDIKNPYIKLENPGNDLENYINGFLSKESYNHDNYSIWLSFQAQEIVANYCKKFNPSSSQISKIRDHYVFEDYENVQVYKDKTEYKFK